jgi:beta-lactam-binding protein with PASTA domain
LETWFQRVIILGKIILVFALLGFVVLFLMDKLVMPLYTRHGQERLVPDLVGKASDQARAVAEKQGCRFVEDKIVHDDRLAAGTVIEQIPPAGTITKSGRPIKAVVSGGEKLIFMPRLIGVSPQGALTTSASLGLVIPKDSIRYRYSERYPRGVVFEQSIPPNSLLRRGTVVSITVSLGEEPLEFRVPRLLGQPLDKAAQILINAGLTVGRIGYRVTQQYPENTVLGQSIKSETEVPKGTTLDLLVARASEPLEPDTTDYLQSNEQDSSAQ